MTPPTCTNRLAGRPNGLRCTRPADHQWGCVYEAAWLADGLHDDETFEED